MCLSNKDDGKMETCTFSVNNNNNNNINNNNNHHLFITFENNVGFKIGS